MNFSIQASNPMVDAESQPTEASLREAIEDIFFSDTEDAFLNWNGVSVALSYKYDLSVMIDDALAMLRAVLSSDQGQHIVTWPSNTFQALWKIEWSNAKLNCSSEWYSVAGNLEQHLTQSGSISLPPHGFVAEWKLPLMEIARGLEKAGYRSAYLPGFDELIQLIDRMKQTGQLYRHNHSRRA